MLRQQLSDTGLDSFGGLKYRQNEGVEEVTFGCFHISFDGRRYCASRYSGTTLILRQYGTDLLTAFFKVNYSGNVRFVLCE